MPRELRVDPDRVRTLETAIRDFRRRVEERDRLRRLIDRIERQFRTFYLAGVPEWRLNLRKIDPRIRMTPSFASIGAVRSGTSTLAQYILQHPCVVLPLAKEIRWGSSRVLDAYLPTVRAQLEVERDYGVAITGICSPVVSSLAFPSVARAVNPQMKLIVCLRNPVERAFSHWRHDMAYLRRGESDLLRAQMGDFRRVARGEMESIRSGGQGYDTLTGQGCGYLQLGICLPFLKVLYREFAADRVKVICAEDMFVRPLTIARELFAFLGLPEVEPVEIREWNAGMPDRLDESVRAELNDFFRPYNNQLYEFLGRDLGWEADEARGAAARKSGSVNK